MKLDEFLRTLVKQERWDDGSKDRFTCRACDASASGVPGVDKIVITHNRGCIVQAFVIRWAPIIERQRVAAPDDIVRMSREYRKIIRRIEHHGRA